MSELKIPDAWKELYAEACATETSHRIYPRPWGSVIVLFERIAALEAERERYASIEGKAHLQTIDERDRAEDALSQAYYLVIGRSPEWSNLFGHEEAVEEIDDAQKCLRAEIAQQAAENARLRLQIDALKAPVSDEVGAVWLLRLVRRNTGAR